MTELQRYHSIVSDNLRWEGFPFRDGDIVLSTPAKCGTTWTQSILALLIFQTPDFPGAMDRLSPWLDQLLRPLDEELANLESQTHRRFIKTHTPLDGLPWDERVTYITCARDPRDVAMSWDNHMTNLDMNAFLTLRGNAVGWDDANEVMADGPPVFKDDPKERLWDWVDADGGRGVGTLADTIHHLKGFWDVRDKPNVILLHYAELKADLEGEMRKLAARLGIEVPEEKWAELVPAATFESMKARASDVAPNSTESIWVDKDRFFNKGTSGQWRDFMNDADLERYMQRVAELAPDDCSAWMHQG